MEATTPCNTLASLGISVSGFQETSIKLLMDEMHGKVTQESCITTWVIMGSTIGISSRGSQSWYGKIGEAYFLIKLIDVSNSSYKESPAGKYRERMRLSAVPHVAADKTIYSHANAHVPMGGW